MPRRARLMLADTPVHLIQRGNNHGACFFADGDYALYVALLEKLAARFGCAIHAWCLMTNHVHLLLTPSARDACSLLMKHLGQHYVQYVNRTYNRSGTLWEGRFRSCLAQNESYVLACHRYIELNPVRAGMVERPDDYPWSSFRVNADGRYCSLVTPHSEYLRLGTDATGRRAAYRELFRGHIAPELVNEIRASTNGGYALGAERFRAEVALALGRSVQPGRPGRPTKAASIRKWTGDTPGLMTREGR
ncbi:MAG: transposase [Betaproteobacteria bacterium]|nr:transposase [Betaproteobacteria bacterium]